ncbi:zinc dependent phospholipase C family protein [uncultured Microscilla sp.]|uniref:zinc dependent phospholipase C family protein n=1 Tax=uncultured Microscilla sp. TaxID=432653 RepID=UPI00262E32BA|nr:zinc dependent phospholipase C family protein [uncultured Microscilla sp.]
MKKGLCIFVFFVGVLPIIQAFMVKPPTDPKPPAWGFFAHQRINRLAVFTLPPEMITFYKFYIVYLTENAINPDARRYAVKGEAPRHFIDVDVYDHQYNDSAVYKMPRNWKDAVKKHTEDTLQAYGIVPWHINFMKYRLTKAFKNREATKILRLSAEIGHYIADANVPLHTTENYNGQLTNQKGIHGFWESRLPELYSDNYNYFVGKAKYIKKPQQAAWQAVINAHEALDSVLRFERELTKRFSADKKYTIDERNGSNIRTYSKKFSKAFHDKLAGQVERRMRASIKMVGDFWYTCWVDGGQPDLSKMLDKKYIEEERKRLEKERKKWQEQQQQKKLKIRSHEAVLRHQIHQLPHHRCCHSYARYYTYLRKKMQDSNKSLKR